MKFGADADCCAAALATVIAPAMKMPADEMKPFRMPILLKFVTLTQSCGVTKPANYTCCDGACHKASC
jgi:hypothetical protein